ncbi:hypothetical protein SASPL_153428 [Salvia splendens]|uniref:Uncharacterized protein n=1 Tax=Salvia splendens TaxID=180675 RepID=A0A8X8Z1S3_SALSN|nr:hypothetical protein SASPL_153428 [Salvia splendens]
MAKFAAALFCLFTVSLARPPPRLTADSSDPALRLPSEPIKADAETDPNFAVVSAVPLTEITFRPVNRPCRGHHFKLHPAMMRRSEPIPFANDVIGENSDFEQPIPTRWTRVRNHHLRQRHRRREDSDSEGEGDDENRAVKRAVFKRFDYDRFDREKRMKKLRQRLRIGNERKEEDEMPGFVKGVRKFLTNYF